MAANDADKDANNSASSGANSGASDSPASLYPPRTAADALKLCAGDWLSLRTLISVSDREDGWHASERKTFQLAWTAPGNSNHPAAAAAPDPTANHGNHPAATAAPDPTANHGNHPAAAPGPPPTGDQQSLGTLTLTAADLPPFWLSFTCPDEDLSPGSGGYFRGSDGRTGRWRFSVEGVLELGWATALHQVSERIWFSKANLRLRSRTVHGPGGADGSVVESCAFYSDIRRMPRPPAAP